MNNESITISFLGVDDRSKSAYQLFLEKIKPVQYKLVDDYEKAQLCLIDKDSYSVQKQYENLKNNYPDKHVLVLSIVEHSCVNDNEYFLQKPVKREVLQRLLNKISGDISGERLVKSSAPTRLQIKKRIEEISKRYIKKADEDDEKSAAVVKPAAKPKNNTVVSINQAPKISTSNAGKLLKIKNEEYFVGDCPDVNINDSEQAKKVFYSPERLLQSIVGRACAESEKSGKIVQLNIMKHVFYIDAEKQKIHSTAGPSVIRPLCIVYYDNDATYSVKPESFRDELDHMIKPEKGSSLNSEKNDYSWSIQAFQWLITLWCSRGRVPEGLDLESPVYLMQWPNLTRLEPLPHAVRIAALLYDQPRTLADAAKQLGIAQRYVFAFFSACNAIGLSDISRRDIDKLFVTEKPEKHKNKSIMSKLLGKLVNFSETEPVSDIASSVDK